jgi:hypothetical protein
MALRELVDVRGLSDTDNAFRRELIRAADRVPMDAGHLAAVIAVETAFTFRTDIRNPRSGFVGLIQFGPAAASTLGTTTDALARMSAREQFGYVVRYYHAAARGMPVETLEDAYLAVFAGRVGLAPDATLYSAPSKAYEQNREYDSNKDGKITAAEATRIVRGIYEAGKQRPPLLVEMSLVPRYVVAGCIAALAAAAAWWARG